MYSRGADKAPAIKDDAQKVYNDMTFPDTEDEEGEEGEESEEAAYQTEQEI